VEIGIGAADWMDADACSSGSTTLPSTESYEAHSVHRTGPCAEGANVRSADSSWRQCIGSLEPPDRAAETVSTLANSGHDVDVIFATAHVIASPREPNH
jgi:hypothetical protein